MDHRRAMTLLVLYMWFWWVMVSAEDVPTTSTYSCSVCKCSETKLQRGRSISADCSNLGLYETPLSLPKKIGTLDMSRNAVNSSQLLHLNKYPTLRHLNASFNRISDFEIPKVKYNLQVLTLDLTGNVLTVINDGAFDKMPYIREIIGLEALEFSPKSLNQLTDLQRLSIVSHQTDIPQDLFSNLKISNLQVNVTHATHLPRKLFRYRTRSLLSNLTLCGTVLQELHEDSLRGLVLLNHIVIEAPNMRSLPSRLFHDTSDESNNEDMPVNLKVVRVIGIRSLPRTIFHKQKSLEHIELHGVEDLPFGLFESVTLDSLDLSGSEIRNLPSDWFSKLSSLRHLNLSNTGLYTIDLSAFNGLQSLNTLDISNNHLERITQALFHQVRRTLITLVAANNSLEELDNDAFDNMLSLEKLDLSKNHLKGLSPSIFSDLGKLVDVNLKENRIHSIPSGILDSQVNMEDLDLGTNLLTGLPSDLFNTTRSLRRINLSGNNITFLPKGIFGTTHFLETVQLGSNPIHCSCDIFLLPKSMFGLELHGLCSSPQEHASIPIEDVPSHYIEACLLTTTIPTIVTRGISISPTPVLVGTDTDSLTVSGSMDSLGSTEPWAAQSSFHIQPTSSLTDSNANFSFNFNFSHGGEFGAAKRRSEVFGALGLHGFYIATSVVASVFIIASVVMAIYRKRRASRSMMYVVNPDDSNVQANDDVVNVTQPDNRTVDSVTNGPANAQQGLDLEDNNTRG